MLMNDEFIIMPLEHSEVPANWVLEVTEMVSLYVAGRFHWLIRGLTEPGPITNVKLDAFSTKSGLSGCSQ